MSVNIRLRRTGKRKMPNYRIVVAESRFPRDGRFLEILGHYNPRSNPVAVSINKERALHWIGVGARPTDTVKRLLIQQGILQKEG